MAGALFIINVPKKLYEEELRKKDKVSCSEKGKYEKTVKIVEELNENKQFQVIRETTKSLVKNNDGFCKSTDYLHKSDTEAVIKGEIKGEGETNKCKDENILNVNALDLGTDKRNYCSWKEIKQIIKPKPKNSKIKITQVGCVEDILAAFYWDSPLETALSEVIARLDIKNATWNSSKDNTFWQVIFSLESNNLCEELLQVLRTFGIGTLHGSSMSVIPCALYFKSLQNEGQHNPGIHCDGDSAWSRFSSSVRTRTNLAQVIHDVRLEATLTFDWLFLLVVAAFVAAIGLVENSTVILVASMLISPLMGPITAGALGTAVRDRSLQGMGVMHELFGLFLSLVIGFVFGLAICAVDERYGLGEWPTYEMMSRCEIRSLWVGVLVAIPSGAGVALAVLGENTASLVGVAISASLLPPAVNAGLFWAMALVHLIFSDDATRWNTVVQSHLYSSNQVTELALLGTVSLCLTLVNILCIFIAGVTVYKVKEVCPLDRRNMTWWRSNKNQASSRRNQKELPKSWDCSAWSCEFKDSPPDTDRKETLGLVQSDTVTYRHNRPLTKRLRAQNIESYCNQRAQTIDDFMSMGFETATAELNYIKDSLDQPRTRHGIKTIHKVYNQTETTSYIDSLENGKNNCENDHPTIEPSINLTIDPKNSAIFLQNKAVDV